MKKMIATIAAITVISITGASAWGLDINVGGVDIGVGDGFVEIDTSSGGGSVSWDSSDD